MSNYPHSLGRREVLKSGTVLGASVLVGILVGGYKFQHGQRVVSGPLIPGEARDHVLLPTPSCTDDDPTPAVSEGPFYAPATPKRSDLRHAGAAGTELILTGRVTDTACRPIPGAVLDFWQTDPAGSYDHYGYDYRGHQFTDVEGRYELLTLLPASYQFLGVWRRRHIHVKVVGPSHKPLTSQVFFPFGPDRSVEDISFDSRLVSVVEHEHQPVVKARFDFVLEQL